MVELRESMGQASLVSGIGEHQRLLFVGIAGRADRFEPFDPFAAAVEISDPREQCLLEHRRREILAALVVRDDAEGYRDK